MKTKAEKILVIGSQGSGIESRLLNHNPKQINRFVIYQSIEEMKRAEDDFYNYNCIIIFSALLISKKDDMDYYEKYLLNATKEERDCYIKEHPDFMNEYPVSYEHRELLQDKIYRGLMRKIRDYEKSREQ